MIGSGKRRVALLLASGSILAGGTAAALGATGAAHPAQHRSQHQRRHARAGTMAAAATYLGLSPSSLRAELASGKTLGEIAASTPGHSESGLVAALVAAAKERRHSAEMQLTSRIEGLVSGTRAAGGLARADHPRLRAVALSYLGVSRSDLRAQLRAGQTLAQVADATPGRSAAGLRAALLSPLRARLDTVAADRSLSDSAKHRRQENLEARVTRLLSRSHSRDGAHSSSLRG